MSPLSAYVRTESIRRIPSWRTPSSPSYLSKALPPSTIALGVKVPTYEFGVYICVCLCVCVSYLVVSNSCNSMDGSLPSSCVHGILQARILEWAAIPFSRGSSRPRDRTLGSHMVWATRKAHKCKVLCKPEKWLRSQKMFVLIFLVSLLPLSVFNFLKNTFNLYQSSIDMIHTLVLYVMVLL